MHPNRRTWRIRGIPRDFDRDRLRRALRHHPDLEDFENGANDVIIHTLSPDLRVDYQVATVRFHNLPSRLRELGAKGQLTVKINIDPEDPGVTDECDCGFKFVIDDHFDGITTLSSPVTDEEHEIDVLAVSGLGSHPFGSFVHKEDGNMWLTNNLPRDIPAARVMIFGYESDLPDSKSLVQLDDLASPLQFAIGRILRSDKRKPLLLIGHSLGGLLVKQALIRIAKSGFANDLPKLLDIVTGILLFGTPNDGLDIESLVPMVNDQPNRSLLESLSSKNSQVLRDQRRDFSEVLERTKLQLVCLYETELSPTAIKDPATGRWKMDGPPRFLVSPHSATSCLPADAPLAYSIALRRNHSDLVKFSSHDSEYDVVAEILKRMQEGGFQIPQVIREPRKGNSITAPQSRLTGETRVNKPSKRPAGEVLSSSVEKWLRLDNHLPENGHPQAGNDHALRDPVLHDEMRDIKEKLIHQLYFSKIDERLTHLTAAQGTTCRWFLTESKYQSWQDVAQQSEHGGFLWIKGNPGTGKSTLMKYLFEATNANSNDDPSRITLSFFFLARGTTEEKTTMGLYCSLLHQLFKIAPDLKSSLEWMTPDGVKTMHRNGWSEETLKHTLRYAVPKLGNRSLTIFVDALDEVDENKAGDMVCFFEELCGYATETRAQLQICFSSRYYPDVVITKGIEVRLEDEIGHTEDIRKYVKLRLRLESKSKHAEALRSEILEKSSGIFLWAVLVVDILNIDKSISIQQVRERLQEIPPKLNDLFQMILARDGDNLEQLQLCLNWILFARRALQPQELYFAIQLGSDKECSGFWDQEDVDLDDMKTFVRSSSKGLAEVTRNKASEVQFIHESVRDFLLGKYGNQWSGTSENLKGHGHQVLRDCCFAQLNTSISQQVDILDPLPEGPEAAQPRNTISLRFPLLNYSVHNIFHHSNLAQRNGIQQGHFISDFPLQRWISIKNAIDPYGDEHYTDSLSFLYIFGKNNLADLIRIHPRRKFCFQIESQRYRVPIFAALAHDSHEAVQAFLRAQAEDEPPTSPLHGLCEQYEQKAKFDRTIPISGRDILRDLILNDQETIALAFVLGSHSHGEPADSSDSSHGEPVDSSDTPDRTPLSLAAVKGHEVLVRLLLQRSADVDQKSGWLDAPLLHAANQGSEANVKLLLERGANIQPNRQGCETPLSKAASNGHVAVVKLLLEEGANVESKDQYGRTPLHQAATVMKTTREAVMRLLLDKGADIDSKNNDGQTVLSSAARRCQGAGFKSLLEKGADIESRDKDGRTPLSWAAGESYYGTEIAKLLLDEGADINSRDKDSRTPLSWAAGNFDYGREIARLLLEKGADTELGDKDGRTPLFWAVIRAGSETAVARLLLEKGADIESRDKDRRTPLSLAVVRAGSETAVARLLLEKGADIDSRDKNGRTPLSWAAEESGSGAAVRLLLEKDADIELRDKDGRTPLSWAASSPVYHDGALVVKLLLERGADIQSKDKKGWTPLSWALSNKSTSKSDEAMITLLREAGADIESKDTKMGKAEG